MLFLQEHIFHDVRIMFFCGTFAFHMEITLRLRFLFVRHCHIFLLCLSYAIYLFIGNGFCYISSFMCAWLKLIRFKKQDLSARHLVFIIVPHHNGFTKLTIANIDLLVPIFWQVIHSFYTRILFSLILIVKFEWQNVSC